MARKRRRIEAGVKAKVALAAVRGDLDWIAMKCLEKNRTRRYETANELARDIECHLGHRPVSAAAPTLRYRSMKYIRRHRRMLATAAGLGLLLMLGMLAATEKGRTRSRGSTPLARD